MNEQKNLIWAMILSAMVVMLYFTFIEGPNTQKARRLERFAFNVS